MIQVCLSLGSNIAPAENLKQAVELLRAELPVLAISRAWKSPAVGAPGPDFLNAAILVCTDLPQAALKEKIIHPIEMRLGRRRSQDKYAPRTIDIDIIIYGDAVLDSMLWTHAHLALPVAELLPGLVEPDSGRSLEQIANGLAHQAGITPCPDVLEGE